MEPVESEGAQRVRIEDLPAHLGEEVRLEGWLHNRRSSGKITFLIVRDGTGFVQAVGSLDALGEEAYRRLDHLVQESPLRLRGRVRQDRRAPTGVEIELEELESFPSGPDYPITPKEHGVDFLLDHRHLWIRTPRQRAILRIRAEVIAASEEFLRGQGFLRVDSPVLTANASEGTTTLFSVDYFGEPAFLSQSGQLYAEASAMALGRVYCFGPTFRAERSKTRRHLIEFWMLEPEAAFVEHEENLRLQEGLVRHVLRRLLERCAPELAEVGRDVRKLEKAEGPFERITYDEGLALLRRQGLELEWGDDFGAPHETALASAFDRPVFVERYPAQAKAFYMQPAADDPRVVLCDDLLAPEGYGEVIGGSQRIHDLELLRRRIRESGLNEADFEWYLDLRRWGSVPHSGFGMGIERMVAWICGLEHVREAIPYPRLLNRLRP
ncbi:MAG: asparagine--tRNA ligase [Bacillota bacterium]|nr:asparagine--tRNA ligase [Bacillota bacterium]